MTFERGEVVREWSALICPEDVDWDSPKVKEALAVNKLTREELQGKPAFADVLPDLLVELAHPVWVAHNAEFDVRMVNQELQRLRRPALTPQLSICTKNLASTLNGGTSGNRLHEVATRFNVPQNGAHRAVADALVCGHVLRAMVATGKLPSGDVEMAVFCKQAEARWKGKFRWP